jgi:hypothetical protein
MRFKHYLAVALVFVAIGLMTAATTTRPNRGYSLIPTTSGLHTLGTSTYKWLSGYITTLEATTVNATTVNATTVTADTINGASMGTMLSGSVDFDDASTTSDSNTVTGAAVGDYVILTANNSTTTTAVAFNAVATTNTLTLYTASDPGTTVSVSYLIWKP